MAISASNLSMLSTNTNPNPIFEFRVFAISKNPNFGSSNHSIKLNFQKFVSKCSGSSDAVAKTVVVSEELKVDHGGIGHGGNGRFPSGGGGGGGGGGEEGNDDNGDELEFGPIMKFEEVMREAEMRGASLPTDMIEAAKSVGLRKLILSRYLDLQGSAWPLGFLMKNCAMLRDRMLADPSFLFKVGTEIVIDSCCATFAEVQKRGKDFWAEFELYAADLLVGIVVDIALVGMLAPYVRIGKRSGSVPSGTFGRLRYACASLPSSVFEAERPGCKFSLQQRIATYFYKGVLYGSVGFSCGIIGQGIANMIMTAKRSIKTSEEDIPVPPLVKSAALWGVFLAVSSNTRYQIINGLEAVVEKSPMAKRLPPVALAFTVGVRFANNIYGGMQFIDWAKLSGVGSKYLDHLIVEGKYVEAASLCPKVLRGSASAWDRWVFHFAHLRQLPVLVPYIPTENRRLRDTAYEVAVVDLATNPTFHKDLLKAVKSWPPGIYSVSPVIAAIEPQLNTSSASDALKEALAELYIIDGQYEKAFALYTDLMKPDVFDFIEKYNLHATIREKVAQLMMIDSKRAVSLFIQLRDLISPSDFVSQLMGARDECDSRYFLHQYLHALFVTSPHAGRDFHDMQVELYAEYDLKMLLPFLQNSQHYTLEKAYDICVKRDLLGEQVFILGRMGNPKQALGVIINKLGDIEEAIEFLSNQHDDDLWEVLIKQSLHKPEMVGMLLEHTVGNLDPLYIVNMVPNGLGIPKLRDRLVKIITDYRTETSLRDGCNKILKADCVNLLLKYFKEARRAVYLSNEEDESRSKKDQTRVSQSMERSLSMKTMEVKSKTRGGGRCCICFDPFAIQSVSIIVFFCCHGYHTTCLMESTSSVSGKKGVEPTKQKRVSYYEYDDNGDVDEDDEDESPSGEPCMRCILCTTAAG